jgi:hypothetical protein
MIDYNKPMQFTSLDGKDVVKVDFSNMTRRGRIAVEVNADNTDHVIAAYVDGPYLFNTDGTHYKSRYGRLTNIEADAAPAADEGVRDIAPANDDDILGTSYTVNGTPAETLGAALILAGQFVTDGAKVEISKVTTYRNVTPVAAFDLAA